LFYFDATNIFLTLFSIDALRLLQHAYNPVDWFPWGEEAFQKAKAEDKPIFLSIGYSWRKILLSLVPCSS